MVVKQFVQVGLYCHARIAVMCPLLFLLKLSIKVQKAPHLLLLHWHRPLLISNYHKRKKERGIPTLSSDRQNNTKLSSWAMARKRKSAATSLDEVDRTMYASFCSAANSLSQLYTQAMNHQKLSFQAGERQGLVRIISLFLSLSLFFFFHFIMRLSFSWFFLLIYKIFLEKN